MFCGQCGRETKGDEKFCVHCGAPVDGLPEEGAPEAEKEPVPVVEIPETLPIPGERPAAPPRRPGPPPRPPRPAGGGRNVAIYIVIAVVLGLVLMCCMCGMLGAFLGRVEEGSTTSSFRSDRPGPVVYP